MVYGSSEITEDRNNLSTGFVLEGDLGNKALSLTSGLESIKNSYCVYKKKKITVNTQFSSLMLVDRENVHSTSSTEYSI